MLKIKVCGMRETTNILELVALKPDFVGFIFYDKSPRFVGEELDEKVLKNFPKQIKKVGVFVNANIDYILRIVKKYDLGYAQLHGYETPDYCKILKSRGVNIIKAFSINKDFNFVSLNNYKPHCEYFLFDTKGENIGGNGMVFDWQILQRYDQEKPFFLSGGISLDNVEEVHQLEEMNMIGIDVNSKFEIKPALKDIEKLQILIESLRPIEQDTEV